MTPTQPGIDPATLAPGTQVTCTDLTTGESESAVIKDDYIIVTDGICSVSGVQAYPTTGTVVVTIKTRKAGA